MKEINNEVLSEFCNQLIEEMEDVNDTEEFDSPIDIPFWISVLHEKLSKDTSGLNDFIADLKRWEDYTIYICEDTESYDMAYVIKVYLCVTYEYDDDYIDNPDYFYEIRFGYDERYYGYCECNPKDEGYRDDKDCCGDVCDWDAPKFSLHKVTNITSHDYDGRQKDCWEFEDEFYKSRKELSEKKASIERDSEIEELTSQLNDIAERIEKLMK